MENDPRYPYTYACDYIRRVAGYNSEGTKLSRADASRIRAEIAKVLGMDDSEFSRKLADHFLKNL